MLTEFEKLMTSELEEIKKINFSEKFYKIDDQKSIKKNNLNSDDFNLDIESHNFKNVLILDDVIDEGKTLEILVQKLYENNLIMGETNIKIGCLYNRAKGNTHKKQIDVMEWFKQNQGEKPSN
ncbi:phosphoribosyltransferase [Gillisia sp. M10.2A]|uniref:Phosphoribosyltransferase n=1 Tax=Gillisia lutea TaxID=2909668 RepID=A0ABS9EAY2_9FLAO|nr:phosphoribosyltransferase [Gillisia lutea]MCF4100045.1 phosphoribosyltransferase [Gillisia lutea]